MMGYGWSMGSRGEIDVDQHRLSRAEIAGNHEARR